LEFSLVIKTTGSRSSLQKPKSESRLLYAGCRLSNNQVLDKLIPGYSNDPGFDSNLWITTRLQRFRFIRLSDSYLPEFIQHFDSNAHYHDSLPQQLWVVWNLLLETDFEGPTFIFRKAYAQSFSLFSVPLCACGALTISQCSIMWKADHSSVARDSWGLDLWKAILRYGLIKL